MMMVNVDNDNDDDIIVKHIQHIFSLWTRMSCNERKTNKKK